MNNEIKSKENMEIKSPELNNYKNIKSETGITYAESTQFWDSVFNDIEKEPSVENEKFGGSYREVKANSDGSVSEVHHMPSDTSSPLDFLDGPTIKMDIEDHRQTASWGSSNDAKEYRAEQKEKIQNGDFRGAIQMDIDDIKEKFGDKYDKAIEQMLSYVDKLETEGKI